MNMTLVNIALVFLDILLFIALLHIVPITIDELLDIWELFKRRKAAEAELTD